MSGLPYPTHDTGFPFPDPNPNNPYGQVAEGSLPYPTSDVPGAFPYPQEAYSSTNIGIPICPATEPTINAVNVPYPYLPYPIEALPNGAPGAVPYPTHDHSIGGSSCAYPFSFPTPEQNIPLPISSSTGDSSQGYPPSSGFDGKDIAEKVEYNEGLRKSLFSKSGLIGKAIDKGHRLSEKFLKSQDSASSDVAPPSDNSQQGVSDTDGNCLGTTSPYYAAPFSHSKGKLKRFCNQDYDDLKRRSKLRGQLFEDREFIPSNRLLVDDNNQYIFSYGRMTRFDGNSIEWLRPHEICQRMGLREGPEMFVGQSDRFDINQGEIGNCWFLAAVANLVENEKCFHRVVPQDQGFGNDYAGIFRFRFWRFGEWVEVIIDDRLPTRNGKLIYLRSVEKNEFWGALLEKAYAKLHGSYKNLEGGLTIEAAVDFTGGIPEMINLNRLKYTQERLFYIMSKADDCGAFMGAALSNSSRISEAQTKGLQARHAYTITKVVEIRSPRVSGGIPLIRLRNPHGNSKEWKGDWCDDDRNWKSIPQYLRNQLGLTFEDDGEFYMSFRDFLKYFGELEICHLSPDSVDVGDNKKKFEVFNFNGSWRAGSTSGGCGNAGNSSFAMNPQFFINLSDPDVYDDITHCPVVISVAQKSKQRKSEHAIGFKVFKCDLTDKLLDVRFFNTHVSIDRVDTFINLREVSKRILLPPGRYCIIPCTFDRGEEGDFLLRVFVERSWGTSEHGRASSVNGSMRVDGSRISKVKPTPRPEANQFPTPIQKPIVDSDSGGIRIIPIQVDPGYQPRREANVVYGERKQNKLKGFAMKQMEKHCPDGLKNLKKFYNWAKDRDSEYGLLQDIVKSFSN